MCGGRGAGLPNCQRLGGVSGSQITVAVKVVGQSTSKTESCTLPAGDRNGCQSFKYDESGHCVITINALTNEQVAARVRGVLFSRKTVPPFSLEAVVQAQ